MHARQVVDVSVTGEAIVNNRKNKLIPAYELEISIKWEGTGSTTGRVLLPYVSDENHDETPEVRWSSETDDETSTKLREAFHAGGKKVRGTACRRVHGSAPCMGPPLGTPAPTNQHAGFTHTHTDHNINTAIPFNLSLLPPP